jgi:hypothetical protein
MSAAKRERQPHKNGWVQGWISGRLNLTMWHYGRIVVLSDLADMELPRAEVDNHHPGHAVNLFLPVDPAHRVDCECKDEEQLVLESDGYTWTTPKDGPCRGCELAQVLPGLRRCSIHGGGDV